MRWPPTTLGTYAGIAMIVCGTAVALQPLRRVIGTGTAVRALIGAAVIGGAFEIAGLYLPIFGTYEYRSTWQPVVRLPHGLFFPLLLPVMWGVILAACWTFARQRVSGAKVIVVGAVVAAVLDLVSEAVLTGPVGFWTWFGPTPLLGAPYSNAVGWFVTSLAGCTWITFALRGVRPRGSEAVWLIASAMFGTALIGVAYHELRGLWALVPMMGAIAWRAPTNS
jgi:uncharacterized membrane protein